MFSCLDYFHFFRDFEHMVAIFALTYFCYASDDRQSVDIKQPRSHISLS